MHRLDVIIKLGTILRSFNDQDNSKSNKANKTLSQAIQKASEKNVWFTPYWLGFALRSWAKVLTRENLQTWLGHYPKTNIPSSGLKKVLIIMAGNLPLVGLHDFICSFLSGHFVIAKLSSKDDILLPALIEILKDDYPDIHHYCSFRTDQKMEPDAIITSGSNATKLHFEYAYPGIPRLLRGNRNSLAVLSGSENNADYVALALDIKAFFGLGCRSISLVFITDISQIERIAEHLSKAPVLHRTGSYANNIRQQRAILKQNNIEFYDSDEMLITENHNPGSAIGVLHYILYNKAEEFISYFNQHKEDIQCVVGNSDILNETVPFGKSQFPDLWDYADGADTMKFLASL